MQSSKSSPKPNPSHPEATVFRFEAIGTHWTIEIFERIDDADSVLSQIKDRIEKFDKNYSRFRTDSLVSEMARKPGSYTLPEDAKLLFDLYKKLHDISGGKVTPLIGSLLEDTGYDAHYSLRPKEVKRRVPTWDEALSYEYPKLHIKKPVVIDIGGAGKGYLVDIISNLLGNLGIEHFCVNAGGDIYVSKPPQGSLQIALEHPDDPEMAIGIATLSGGSICGSSGNRRAWRGFTHILDPEQQQSPEHIKSVWVCASEAMVADALTTCLFFVQPTILSKYFAYDYAIVNSDNSLVTSQGFPGDFFSE